MRPRETFGFSLMSAVRFFHSAVLYDTLIPGARGYKGWFGAAGHLAVPRPLLDLGLGGLRSETRESSVRK